MLFNPPPGYKTPAVNRQTPGGLSMPGLQSNAIIPGYAQNNNLMKPSSFSPPSSQPSSLNQYFQNGNGNQSQLLRALVGNKH
jgi:hypothetical protein